MTGRSTMCWCCTRTGVTSHWGWKDSLSAWADRPAAAMAQELLQAKAKEEDGRHGDCGQKRNSMNTDKLQKLLAEAHATIQALQDELGETNRGLVALNLELDDRVAQRTAELAQANEALRAEITERKRIEEERERLLAERKRQSKFLESLIDNAPIGVAVLGPGYALSSGQPGLPVDRWHARHACGGSHGRRGLPTRGCPDCRAVRATSDRERQVAAHTGL